MSDENRKSSESRRGDSACVLQKITKYVKEWNFAIGKQTRGWNEEELTQGPGARTVE